MGKKIIAWCVKNRLIVLVFTLMFVALGIYNYYIMPKQEAPDVTPPYALITVVYPGASAVDVESLVTSQIELGLKELAEYKTMRSYSNDSLCTVLLELNYGIDTDKSFDDIHTKMQELQKDLPSGCNQIEINTDLIKTAGIMMAFYSESDSYTTEQLNEYAATLKNELSTMDGISRLDIEGVRQQRITVNVDIDKLNTTSVSMDDITRLLAAQSASIPIGVIHEKENSTSVTVEGPIVEKDDIGEILLGVNPEDGKKILLKDIATIEWEDSDSNFFVEHNSHHSVLLNGYFKDDINVLLVGDEIRNKMDEVLDKFPDDIKVHEVLYQPDDVRGSVNQFAGNLLQGVLLVILVVLVSMGFRNAIIVSTAIPLSILVTFTLMEIFGIKIHRISVASLIVALGMLVDNAIVVSDAIQIRLDRGEKKKQACILGAKDVAMPVLTSTLTTLAAFSPLLFLHTMAGEYVSALPQILIISLLCSYAVAMLVTPAMAMIFFKKRKDKKRKSMLRGGFKRMLKASIKKPILLWILVILMVAGSGFLMTLLPLQLFPNVDGDILYIDITADNVQHISQTRDVVHEVQQYLDTRSEVVNYTSAIGNGLPRFYSTLGIPVQRVDIAQIMMRVDYNKDTYTDNTSLLEDLQEGINGLDLEADVRVKQLEFAVPSGADVIVTLTNDEYGELHKYIKTVKDEMADIDGTVDIRDNYNEMVDRYVLKLDNEAASNAGIHGYSIKNEASLALMGRNAASFTQDGNDYDIFINSDANSIDDLLKLKIKSPASGSKIAMSELADKNESEVLPSITKKDGKYSLSISCDVENGTSALDVTSELEEALGEYDFEDVEYSFAGERKDIKNNFSDIGILAIFAVVLIFLLILMHFKNFKIPLVIFITIPLSAVGAIVGLYLTGQPLSFVALLGVVALLGIVVNNAIVLIDCAQKMVEDEGMSSKKAAKRAAWQRSRPILLTAITTIIGMIPLIYGSVLFRPMAVALISGLLLSMLLTLVVIPAAIAHMRFGNVQIDEKKDKKSKKKKK